MVIPVGVNGQKLKVSSNMKNIVAGTQEFIRFEFDMDDNWDNLTTFAQFNQNGEAYNVYLDSNNAVYLPAEITDGSFTLSLYGSSGTIVGVSMALTFTVEGCHLVEDASSTEITQTLYQQLVEHVDELEDATVVQIGTLSGLTTTAKSNLVAAINEVDGNTDSNTTAIGTLTNLTTTEKDSLTAAINEVDEHADTNAAAIGTLSGLSTAAKGNLVAAINEVDGHADTNASAIGTLSGLTTTAKSSLVTAVNELNSNKVSVTNGSSNGQLLYSPTLQFPIGSNTTGSADSYPYAQLRRTGSNGTYGLSICVYDSASSYIFNNLIDSTGKRSWVYPSELYYASGNTFTMLQSSAFAGIITSSRTRCYITVPVDKSMEYISSISVASMIGGARIPAGGYINGYQDSDEWVGEAGLTFTATKCSNRMVRILVQSERAFTNGTDSIENNTPVTFFGRFELSFST